MSAERVDQRALPPPQEHPSVFTTAPQEQKTPFVLTSDTFVEYLLDQGYKPEITQVIFPEHLDLSWLTPSIEEIYAATQAVYIVPEKERQHYQQIEEDYGIFIPVFDPATQLLISPMKKGEAERARIIYYNTLSGWVRPTEITIGDYTEVEPPWASVENDPTNDPLIVKHTHPVPSLFSPPDYQAMITDKQGLNQAPAIMVLCPDMQILAVVTPETPRVPESEAELLVKAWSQEEKEIEEKKLALKKQIYKGINDFVMFQKKVIAQEKAEADQIQQKQEFGFLSSSQAKNDIHAGKQLGTAKIQDYIKTVWAQTTVVVHREFVELFHTTDNLIRVKTARAAQVKLYFSTNRKDFYEFTA